MTIGTRVWVADRLEDGSLIKYLLVDSTQRTVWLATGRADANARFVTGKRIAAALGISIQRFKQLCKKYNARPSAESLAAIPDYIREGALRRAALFPKNANGKYELTAREIASIRSSELVLIGTHPDSLHDPVTGKIVGKTFRTTRRERGLSTRPSRKAKKSTQQRAVKPDQEKTPRGPEERAPRG